MYLAFANVSGNFTISSVLINYCEFCVRYFLLVGRKCLYEVRAATGHWLSWELELGRETWGLWEGAAGTRASLPPLLTSLLSPPRIVMNQMPCVHAKLDAEHTELDG